MDSDLAIKFELDVKWIWPDAQLPSHLRTLLSVNLHVKTKTVRYIGHVLLLARSRRSDDGVGMMCGSGGSFRTLPSIMGIRGCYFCARRIGRMQFFLVRYKVCSSIFMLYACLYQCICVICCVYLLP